MSSSTSSVTGERRQPHSLRSGLPEFGQRKEGCATVQRPGAYAIILDDDRQRVALVRTPRGSFLPGGGLDPGEPWEEGLRREILEECGYESRIVRSLGEAIEHVFAEDTHYEIHCAFFEATLTTQVGERTEQDHELVWSSIEEAAAVLRRSGQVWALRQATSGESG